MAICPGHLASDADTSSPNVSIFRKTPPTVLVQAEDDYADDVNQSLVYYAALANARGPAKARLYARGGHAFGLRRTQRASAHWPILEAWMIGIPED